MIDDNWQDRYGTWKFDCEKFSDPKGMIEKLHSMGFKVMLWIVPFISSDSPVYRELERKKLLIFADRTKTKPAKIEWWNGVSALVDLSNPEGRKWFKDQLHNLVKSMESMDLSLMPVIRKVMSGTIPLMISVLMTIAKPMQNLHLIFL